MVGCVIAAIVLRHPFVVFAIKLSKVCLFGVKDVRMAVIWSTYVRGFATIDYVQLDVVTLASINKIFKFGSFFLHRIELE